MAKEIALAIAFLAVVVTAQFDYCLRKETDITAWDTCGPNNLGQQKSKSVCYYHTPTAKYIYRYDFFNCVKGYYGTQTYYMVQPANCSGVQSPVASGAFYDVFNRYDAATRTCTLTPPPPPTVAPPTTAAPTTVAPTTAAPTASTVASTATTVASTATTVASTATTVASTATTVASTATTLASTSTTVEEPTTTPLTP